MIQMDRKKPTLRICIKSGWRALTEKSGDYEYREHLANKRRGEEKNCPEEKVDNQLPQQPYMEHPENSLEESKRRRLEILRQKYRPLTLSTTRKEDHSTSNGGVSIDKKLSTTLTEVPRDVDDNFKDPDGYYRFRIGEVLDGRYEILAVHGKGVFSTVVRAKDLLAPRVGPELVAVKIIRDNHTMRSAGKKEIEILERLAREDPKCNRHCVRFHSSFRYRRHLSLVFESLHMNLREVVKKYGRGVGLKLTAVRSYARQLFVALRHLTTCGVLHSDIKPDNVLVNEAKNVLKLCDFGSALYARENEITPYLVSRFYRAPEVILGLPYGHPMDMWSVGCCLFELYTGNIMFPGSSNNAMLHHHMQLKGSFPKKMLNGGRFTGHHFDQDYNFSLVEEDPLTRKTTRRLLLNIRRKDIGSMLPRCSDDDPGMLAHFKDLLEKIFVLDPAKRITVAQALSHPFIMGVLLPVVIFVTLESRSSARVEYVLASSVDGQHQIVRETATCCFCRL